MKLNTCESARRIQKLKSYHGLLCLDRLDLQTIVLFRGRVVVLPLVRIPAQRKLPWRATLAVPPRLPGLGRRARVIAPLFLGNVRLRPVYRLNMLP